MSTLQKGGKFGFSFPRQGVEPHQFLSGISVPAEALRAVSGLILWVGTYAMLLCPGCNSSVLQMCHRECSQKKLHEQTSSSQRIKEALMFTLHIKLHIRFLDRNHSTEPFFLFSVFLF